jgi:hypothetical protein
MNIMITGKKQIGQKKKALSVKINKELPFQNP